MDAADRDGTPVEDLLAPFLGGEVFEPGFSSHGTLRLRLVSRGQESGLRYGPFLTVRTRVWRVDTPSGPLVAGMDSVRFIQQAVQCLAGEHFSSVRVKYVSLDTTFVFGTFSLRVFPDSFHNPNEEGPDWTWSLKDGEAIYAGPAGRWSLRKVGRPDG
ncbi:hypothetical protein F0L68_36030 [Solihabitans fulvus]|uniref:Uncharacterized protein n=1 Tax=Solihabitans fulvus TaxID=1892852 RepID=A0A5B2WKX0_9PSEU|nr:hypothetical protein [Solihabitans fulvus]KAA2252451.1 hypothetical protein F0L68_36030 [Solihabitans fulvus]